MSEICIDRNWLQLMVQLILDGQPRLIGAPVSMCLRFMWFALLIECQKTVSCVFDVHFPPEIPAV